VSAIDPPDRSAWHRAWGILVAGLLVRLVIAADYPLLADEAYYWTWSRELALGYYDHPPVIALLIAAGTALFGDTPFGVRVIPNLLGFVTAAALVVTARQLAGHRAALHVALLSTLVPVSAAGSILATPDAPLLAGIAVTWMAVLRAADDATRPSARLAWWAIAGVAIGIAMASKFTGVLIPAAIAISSALIPRYRELLRAPGPYLAVAIASVLMAPVLWWNAQHEWVTFAFQIEHGLGTLPDRTSAATLRRLAELFGGQIGLTGVLAGVLMAAAAFRAIAREQDPVSRLLARSSLLIFAFFVVSAFQKPVEANWPAVAYPSFVLLLAVAFARGFAPRLIRPAHALSGLLTLAVYAYALGVIPAVKVEPTNRDPFNRAYGWDQLAMAMDGHRRDVQRALSAFLQGSGTPTVHLAANFYQDASQLAFRVPGRPFVPALNIAGRTNQFDYWPGFAERAQPGDALLLALDTMPRSMTVVDSLSAHFGDVTILEELPMTRGGRPVAWRRLWLFTDWRGTWLPRPTAQDP
jgi:4-amino-4-deoxy-L-arabinose transferase-like glycosyltransferase